MASANVAFEHLIFNRRFALSFIRMRLAVLQVYDSPREAPPYTIRLAQAFESHNAKPYND